MPLKVLIADDHPMFRQALLQALRPDPAFADPYEAGDGQTALRLIHDHRVEVAVLDVSMPVQSGMDVARQIQREGLRVAVVFVTAFKDTRLYHEARQLGVRGYILKESAVTEILEGIKTVACGGLFTSPALSRLLAQRKQLAGDLVRATPGLAGLSPTQRRILKLIASDKTSKEIADELGISHRTVENHRGNIAVKLDIRGSHSLLKFAYDNKDALDSP